MLANLKDLAEYLERYAPVLGTEIARRIKPLHTPATDPVISVPYKRPPLPAQDHVITAIVKQWRSGRKLAMCNAAPGGGKTLLAACACHAHANGRPYRAVVTCPPHLVEKWVREIDLTIDAKARILAKYHEATAIDWHGQPDGAEWYIVSNSTAKLGTSWRAAVVRHWKPGLENVSYCPSCQQAAFRMERGSNVPEPIPLEDLEKRQHFCEFCKEALWQWTDQLDRWPVAKYLHGHARRRIDYVVIDEAHETKGAETAIGNSAADLAATAKRILTLTGTILGGYAEHMFYTLYRTAPTSLVSEGVDWGASADFNERYGRMERRVTTVTNTGKSGSANKQSQGKVKSTRTTRYVRPGVMPTLYGRHMIKHSIFLGLDEIADNLPPLTEEVISVDMDAELAAEYQRIEDAIASVLKGQMTKGSAKILGMMLSVLLGYPDKSYGWEEIGYEDWDPGMQCMVWNHVVQPMHLDQRVTRNKERELVEYVLAEKKEGRQVWIYTTMTKKRDVTARLQRLLEEAGVRTGILTSEVEARKREDWIAKNGRIYDACISHPMLVQTGFDLFDKGGGHNFCTLAFYLTGYNTFVLRQAGCRSWRIGQQMPCKVAYFHYANTMQARALTLMGKKLVASQAIEGKFSTEGLAAMAGDDSTMETALARSLVEKMEDLDVGRAWERLGAAAERISVGEVAKPKQVFEFGGETYPPPEEEEEEPKLNARSRRLKQKFLFAGG